MTTQSLVIHSDAQDSADVITLMIGSTDPYGRSPTAASKLFSADGLKKSRTPKYFMGVQVHVPDVHAMARLLELVGESPSAALCNCRFPGLPVYSLDKLNASTLSCLAFLVWPQNEVNKKFKSVLGVHTLPDKRFVVARLTKNTLPTGWLMLDRDLKSTAPRWAKEANWLELLEKFMPGLVNAPRVDTRSSSSRVHRNGTPVGAGHGHIWVHMIPPTQAEVAVARRLVRAAMVASGYCWVEPNKNGKPQIILPIDLSTWSACRMAYSGKPEVSANSGLTVGSTELQIFNATGLPYSLHNIPSTSPAALEDATRKLQPDTNVRIDSKLNVVTHDLLSSTTVELECGGVATLADIEQNLRTRKKNGELNPKQRMQSPLRPDSRSMAAFAGLTSHGQLFVRDSGLPDETHFLACSPDEFKILMDGHNGADNQVASIASAKILRLLSASELTSLPPMKWHIKGVLPERGIAGVYGPSGSGKSFLVLSMLAGIASGSPDWHGYKCKKAPVIYVALEGEAGMSQRIKAYSEYYRSGCPNMQFIISPLSLLDEHDITLLVQAIRNAGYSGAVVCIDTLAQATPGGDENSSADMGRAISACKKIQTALDSLVILVHHTGKQVGQGPRGHSSLFAALDAAIEVRREGNARTWAVAKSKDGADGSRHGFELRIVNLGVDEDLDIISSCVALPTITLGEQKDQGYVTPSAQAALKVLIEVCATPAAVPCPGGHGANLPDWRSSVYSSSKAQTREAKEKSFSRARRELKEAGLIDVLDDVYWPIGYTPQPSLAAHTI